MYAGVWILTWLQICLVRNLFIAKEDAAEGTGDDTGNTQVLQCFRRLFPRRANTEIVSSYDDIAARDLMRKNEAEYKERYVTSLNLLNELRGKGIAGGIYTQTTDVEGEINGLMTYDRKVIKFKSKKIRKAHEELFQAFREAVK